MSPGRQISVIGLGYVGLPVALAFVRAGNRVVAFDISERRVTELKAGVDSTGEVDPALLSEMLAREWRALWFIMVLAIAQTVLGVWRPRRRRRRSS